MRVRTPCGESWEAMERRGMNRHCRACDREVVDLSVLTRRQAEARLAAAQGKLCGRLAIDGSGRPVFKKEPERSAVAAIVLAGALGACSAEAAASGAPRSGEVAALSNESQEPDSALDLGPPMLPASATHADPPAVAVAEPVPVVEVAEIEVVEESGPTPEQRALTRRKRRAQAAVPTHPTHHFLMGDLY